MAYKDKDKQREADRERQRRRRDKIKAKGVTNQGVTEIIDGVTEAPPPKTPYPKRGKDIKCFADLPPDVQQTIDIMSRRDGKIDPMDKIKRTAAAINYQHLYPDRYNSVMASVVVAGDVVYGQA